MGTILSNRPTSCTVCGKPGIGYRRSTCSQDCADYARAHSVDQCERRKQRVSDGETWDAAEVCEQLEAIRCGE